MRFKVLMVVKMLMLVSWQFNPEDEGSKFL
jgi:hypothetical protein